MPSYHLAQQELYFPCTFMELIPFEKKEEAGRAFISTLPTLSHLSLSASCIGWIGNAQRMVEVYDTPAGVLLKIEEGGEFLIASHGEAVYKRDSQADLTKLDREIVLGPALVLALALRSIWCLHASAAMYQSKTIVFLGESGQGKSTLASYLSHNPNWRLVADDILPVRIDTDGVSALPHFPQLKLSAQAQPGPGLPECLPLATLCVLTPAGQDTIPELQLLPPSLAIQMLLRHTAGTRMFTPELLGGHLTFCALVAGQVPVYRLTYPHRWDALPVIKGFLENLC